MVLDYISKIFLVLGILFFIAALYHLYKNDVLETISGVKEFEQAQEIYNQKLDESRKVFDDLNKKNINRGGDTGEVKILSELSIIPAKSDASRELEDLEALYKQAEKRMREEEQYSEKTAYLDEEEQTTYLDNEKTSFLEDEFVNEDKTSFLEEDDEKTSFLEVEDEKTEFLSDNEEKTTFLNMDDEKTDFLSNDDEKTTFLD